jgi:AcrR family transcriptional regulator
MVEATAVDEDKRARILAAARAVCAHSGLEAARMEAIAAEARVSKGTLYRFFESKEELLLASLIESHLNASHTTGEGEALARVAPERRLEVLLEEAAGVLPVATERMPLNMQAWGLVAGDAGRRRLLDRALSEQVYPLRTAELADALRAGIEAGVYRDDVDPEDFAAVALAIFDGTLYRSTFDPEHANGRALRASYRMMLDALRAPARGEADGDA